MRTLGLLGLLFLSACDGRVFSGAEQSALNADAVHCLEQSNPWEKSVDMHNICSSDVNVSILAKTSQSLSSTKINPGYTQAIEFLNANDGWGACFAPLKAKQESGKNYICR